MRFLSGKEKKEIIGKLPKGYSINKKDELKEDLGILYLNSEKFLIDIDGKLFPHLKSLPENSFPKVFTDRGAIPFVAKGADLMKPGIRRIEGKFESGETVVICEEDRGKAYAIGTSLLNSSAMEEQSSGKSIEIYHFLGDTKY